MLFLRKTVHQSLAIVLFFIVASLSSVVTGQENSFRPLPVFDASKTKPSMFSDSELDLPYYLVHFGKVANSVVEQGPTRGYIELPVWRSPSKPFNARVMENIIYLSFFYTANRPWNIYYNAPGLRDRLEAALKYWLSLQSTDGALPQYAPQNCDLAATSFGAVYMSQSLRFLEGCKNIDTKLVNYVKAAERKAIVHLLNHQPYFDGAKNWTNQYSAVWVVVLNWLQTNNDTEIEQLFKRRLRESVVPFQSPVGYLYEAGGPDWNYTVGTHFNNTANALSLTSNNEIREILIEEQSKYIDWLSYNVVPFNGKWMLNTAIECRSYSPSLYWSSGLPESKDIVLARAFVKSREEVNQELAEARKKLEREWPKVDSLKTFNPRVIMYHALPEQWLPSNEQKQEAKALVPVVAKQEFIHQRADDRSPIAFTYIRHPAYYAMFAGGKQINDKQRLGLGLVWGNNGLMQSSRSKSWGTLAAGNDKVYEAGNIDVTYSSGKPLPGKKDIDAKTFTVQYPLGNAGSKKIEFGPNSITVTINHPGEFSEQIPASPNFPVFVDGKPVDKLPIMAKDKLVYSFNF